MGLYQRRKMAIYSWSRLLIIFLTSIFIFWYSKILLNEQKNFLTHSSQMVIQPKYQKLSMEDWLNLAQKFRLHLLRFRPKPVGGFDIWIQGDYPDLLKCLKNLAHHYPEIRWQKILMENKGSLLTMHLEAGG